MDRSGRRRRVRARRRWSAVDAALLHLARLVLDDPWPLGTVGTQHVVGIPVVAGETA